MHDISVHLAQQQKQSHMGSAVTTRSQSAASPVIATDAASHLHVLLVDPADPRHLLLGQHSGLVESHDGGATWAWGTGPLAHSMVTALLSGSRGTFYAAGVPLDNGPPLGLWRSEDGARTWRRRAAPATNITALAGAPGSPATLYLAAYHQGMFATRNSDVTWRRLSGNLQDQGLGTLAVDPANPTHLLAGTVGGLWDSADGGRTWRPIGVLQGQIVAAVAFAPWPHGPAFAGSTRALWRSDDDGRTWQAQGAAPPGVAGPTVLSPAARPTDPILVGTTSGLYAAPSPRGAWQPVGTRILPATTVAVLARDPHAGATSYAGYSFPSRLYKSTDGGRTWTKLAGP